MTPLLLSVGEVAALLSVSANKVCDMTVDGEMPGAITVGSRCQRWREVDLRSWVEEGCPRYWNRKEPKADV